MKTATPPSSTVTVLSGVKGMVTEASNKISYIGGLVFGKNSEYFVEGCGWHAARGLSVCWNYVILCLHACMYE